MENSGITKQSKILITGITSKALRPLAEKLIKSSYEVQGVSRRYNAHIHDTDLHIGDLRESDFVKRALQNVDIVIHGAGVTHSVRPEKYMEVNYEVTKKMVDEIASADRDITFIYISSRVAVPGSGSYGESKLLAEQYIKKHLSNYIIIRPSEIFGIEGEGIDDFLHSYSEKKMVLAPGGLKDKMYPVFIDDFTSILFDKVVNCSEYRNKEITINGAEGYTYMELVKALNNTLGLKKIIIPIPKFILLFVGFIAGLFKMKVMGIVPDQIQRLYCSKEHDELNYPFLSILDYYRQNFS